MSSTHSFEKVNSQLPGLGDYQATQENQEDVVMATRMTAKKARNESMKLLFQTVLIVLASIGLVVGIIFYVIPYMIRFAGNLTGITLLPSGDTVPPVVPTYSVPYVATNSAELAVNGYAESKSKVIAVLNGEKVTDVVVGDEGKFDVTLNLQEGTNTLALYSEDEAKNESMLGKEFSVTYDNQPPEFEWNDPEDGRTITSLRDRMITIKGKTEPTAKVTLNDRFMFVSGDGSFHESYQLSEGENVLKLVVTDQAGNKSEAERKVTFKP